MNRDKFMKTLKKKLKFLPKEERESAIDFYENYFNDAESEEIALSKLASPEEIATGLLIEFGESKKPLSKSSIFMLILLSPIYIPLGIVGLALLFTGIVLLFTGIIVGLALVLGLATLSFSCLISIIPAFVHNFETGILFTGVFLVSIPFNYFLFQFLKKMSYKITDFLKIKVIKVLKGRYKI